MEARALKIVRRERVNEQKRTDRGTVPRALDPGPMKTLTGPGIVELACAIMHPAARDPIHEPAFHVPIAARLW